MPGDESQSFGLLRLRQPPDLSRKRDECRLRRPRQRMFLVSSSSIWHQADCRRIENWTFDGASADATGKPASDPAEEFQTEDDRFASRTAGLCESVAEWLKCSRRQRRSIGRRYYLCSTAKRHVLLSSVPSGQIHAPDRRLEGGGENDGATRHWCL